MTAHPSRRSVPVVDVDQAFPALVGPLTRGTAAAATDQAPTVRAAIRDVLGVRTRVQDPDAFTGALTAAFRLVRVEGHVEHVHVPRGYAVQADLGAVTGGQASLYRRAATARVEILRVLDGLTALRNDGDDDDMEAYRTIVRNAVDSVVEELGNPGGPRVAMVDAYLDGLTGSHAGSPDTVEGQLGALRERFGLVDDNVNTIEEEGLRTAYWTLVDMVCDLRTSWQRQRTRFTGAAGDGFLGTELIHMSRLMEAASDQVDELELILDSVLVPLSERQTVRLDETGNLTLDGLLQWLRSFLSDEGRRLAQDAGRDGIVAALAPACVALATTFKQALADALVRPVPLRGGLAPVRFLPTSCCQRWPAGMHAARVQIAVGGLCRLLVELARRAQRIGRWAGVLLVDVEMMMLDRGIDDGLQTRTVNVEFRGHHLRPSYSPAFLRPGARVHRDEGCRVEETPLEDLVLPLRLTSTSDDESVSALFRWSDVLPVLLPSGIEHVPDEGLVAPAAALPVAIVDRELGRVVHAPIPRVWPQLVAAPEVGVWPDKGGPFPEVDVDFDDELEVPSDPPDDPPEDEDDDPDEVSDEDDVADPFGEKRVLVDDGVVRDAAADILRIATFERVQAERRLRDAAAQVETLTERQGRERGARKGALTTRIKRVQDDVVAHETELAALTEIELTAQRLLAAPSPTVTEER